MSVLISSTNVGVSFSVGIFSTKNTAVPRSSLAPKEATALYTARRRRFRTGAVRASAFLATTALRRGVALGVYFIERCVARKVRPLERAARTSAARKRRVEEIINYTERRARPLRRRRRRVLRPAVVLLRTRKPWVRPRLRFLGWYVCDIRRLYTKPLKKPAALVLAG